MKDIKDNFSAQSDAYAKFRPGYPPELYTFLWGLVREQHIAWDCATGNGQVAVGLSAHFNKVCATDISEAQLKNAPLRDNIAYSVTRAESTPFPDNYFDLVTVAQAIHWFDFDAFYREVKRVVKPGGILAVIGYGLLRAGDGVDEIIEQFYHNIVGPYWDKERKYIDENYRTIPFPFKELEAPSLQHSMEWGPEDILGYLRTWSAVQHYIKAKGQDPVQLIEAELTARWPAGSTRKVEFPLLLRIASITK